MSCWCIQQCRNVYRLKIAATFSIRSTTESTEHYLFSELFPVLHVGFASQHGGSLGLAFFTPPSDVGSSKAILLLNIALQHREANTLLKLEFKNQKRERWLVFM